MTSQDIKAIYDQYPRCCTCGKLKMPWGRDTPDPHSWCYYHPALDDGADDGCEGYRNDPQPVSQWPSELIEEAEQRKLTETVGPTYSHF